MSNQSSRGKEWTALAASIKDRDGHVCTIRGAGCSGDRDLTVDHIIPKDKGGQDVEENLRTACRTCNGRKGNRTELRTNWIDTAFIAALKS